jgi:hypothetical protein
MTPCDVDGKPPDLSQLSRRNSIEYRFVVYFDDHPGLPKAVPLAKDWQPMIAASGERWYSNEVLHASSWQRPTLALDLLRTQAAKVANPTVPQPRSWWFWSRPQTVSQPLRPAGHPTSHPPPDKRYPAGYLQYMFRIPLALVDRWYRKFIF